MKRRFPVDYLEPYEKTPKCLNVIVETPKGSRVKYSYDEKKGVFQVSKALPEGMVFPYNFGFVPGTLAPDGDPLDVLVLNEEPVVSNTLLCVRPLAVIQARQVDKKKGEAVRNDRIVGQAFGKESPLELRELKLEKAMLQELKAFFQAYNRLYGKEFKILGVGGSGKAKKLVKRAVRSYQKGKKKK